MDDIFLSTLKQYWGYPSFRGIQRQIIESIAAGRDTLGLMPTGGGKSITFQVPALTMSGTCLVFTPLISLMKDQVDALTARGIRAAYIHSGLTRTEVVNILDTAVFGGYKLLYIAPERLQSELFLKKLPRIPVSFITVDEAHCICYWGYDFRPAYLQIAQIRQHKPQAPILALTASATPLVVSDIQRQLQFRAENVFRMSFARHNLHYCVELVPTREQGVLRYLEKVPGPCIVYVHNRQNCQSISRFLQEHGHTVTFYHAGLSDALRHDRQNRWMNGEYRVMVATNAFGMGIDKPDVRLVLHMDLPDSLEAYYQEAGRAGRDGKPSYAVIPIDGTEIVNFRRRAAQTFPDLDFVRLVYEQLGSFLKMAEGDGFMVTREFDLQQFCRIYHKHPATTESALQILEAAGYIRYADKEESNSRMLILATRQELYQAIDHDKESIFNCILRHYGGIFVEYCYIEEAYISQQTGIQPHAIYEALKQLSRSGIISYIPPRRIARITYLQRRVDKDQLSFPRHVYHDRKEKYDERSKYMERYCTSTDECRSSMIQQYFGEKPQGDCGQCDVCQSRHPSSMSLPEAHTIRAQILQQLQHGRIQVFALNTHGTDATQMAQVLREMVARHEIEVVGGIYLQLASPTE